LHKTLENYLVAAQFVASREVIRIEHNVEHKLRVFDNRAPRTIFRPKKDEVTGSMRKQHDLYFSPSIIKIIESRRMRWAGHVARMGEKRELLVGKPEGKRPI
jgi:hypothetical protein